MASGDETTNVSDEKFDYECTPCKEEDSVREAKFFCPECSEYYCRTCESPHSRLKATKSHKVLSVKHLFKKGHPKQTILLGMYCGCNENQLVEFVCDEHHEVFCSECKTFHHRKCEVSTIGERSETHSHNSLNLTLERGETIVIKAERLQNMILQSTDKIRKSEKECKEEIEAYRNELYAFVDEISDNSLLELQTSALTHSRALENSLSMCTSLIQKMKKDKKTLQDAVSSGDARQIFVSDFNVTKKYEDYETLIHEIENDTKIKVIYFQADKTVTDFQTTVSTLGTVRLQCAFVSYNDMVPIEDKFTKFSLPDAEKMTGSTFMPNGNLLLCESMGKCIKLYDASFKEMSKMQLSERPWDISAVTETLAVISLPWKKQLLFVEILTSLKPERSVDLNRKCFGIATAGDQLFVSCSNDPGEGEVWILDKKGNIQKTIGEDLLTDPTYISVDSKQQRVFVSDYNANEIICLTFEGDEEFRYSMPINILRGLILDENANVFICEQSDRCIYAITEAGGNHVKFLTLPKDAAAPACMSYRDSDHTLVVTCEKMILAYKLK